MADNTRLPLGTLDGDVIRNVDQGGVKTQIVIPNLGGGLPSSPEVPALSLQNKGTGATTLNGAVIAGATSVTLTAVTGLQAGQQLRLDRAVGTEEIAFVSKSYVPGTLTVALQGALANAHASGSAAEWDVFKANGPEISGFSPSGLATNAPSIYDSLTDYYFLTRSATLDGVSGQNIPFKSVGLYNGATFDRQREGAATGAALVSLVDNSTGSFVLNAASYATISGGGGVLTGFPISTAGYGKLYVFIAAASSFLGSLIWEGSNDGWVTSAPIYAANVTVGQSSYGPSSSVNNPAAGVLYEMTLTHAAVRVRCSAYTSGSLTVQWNAKSPGTQFKTMIDQGAAGSVGGSWTQKITDGTNGPVAVKPASTVPAATDPALVVALSPNAGLPDNVAGVASPSNIGGSVGTGATGVIIGPYSTTGFTSLIVVCTATGGGTLSFQGSDDNWTTVVPVQASRIDGTTLAPSSTATAPTVNQIWELPLKFAQVRVSAASAGSSYQWVFKNGPPAHVIVEQGAANGSALWSVISKAGSANTNLLAASAYAVVNAATNNYISAMSAGRVLYALDFCNSDTTWAYLKLFNGAPTMGVTNALVQYGIPPGGSKTISFGDIGLYFSSGIYAAITANIGLADNTSLTNANKVTGTIHYV